ncbi:hypothetical protein PLESTB_000355700 [Pleodorina starrii]|uniref:Carbohydrate kinase PfkB domain-containing protein n=1 Tax=Pleodorina starrii TaxID=330485 RepID=A0A9W6EZL0_9CHLO|nr:hypothetical protein PLESTM_000039600 [Pleodorina starrii]GLC50221.1 hypothetical protein PLESTB_000355700 [Pleodorina starrii]GLC64400.1 hypothetical protein PLESTF_000157300 [Pleodorina starrii]
MADGRLAVLLAHLAPEQQGGSSPPGARSEAPWFAASNGPLVIVGGVCLDIQAQPSSVDVQRGTSVPGQVRQVPGGVGRNMAEALSGLLPPDRPAPVFVSLVGDDTAGAFLTASLRRLRLDLTQLVTCPGAPTPCVSAVLDRGGEVAACVADVTAVEQHLTPERLRECQPQIQQACMLLAEANLSAEALEFVSRTAARARVPVFLEPVSVPKAARLVPALSYATFVSPNAAELMSMADEVRRAARLPLLPRPVLPDDSGERSSSGGSGSKGGTGGGGGGREPSELVEELLRQLAAFAEVLLAQGTSCVVLTLGSLGAALVTLADADAAPRAALEPLDACSNTAAALGAFPHGELTQLGPGGPGRGVTASPTSALMPPLHPHPRAHPHAATIHAARCAASRAAPTNGAGAAGPCCSTAGASNSCRGPLASSQDAASPLLLASTSSSPSSWAHAPAVEGPDAAHEPAARPVAAAPQAAVMTPPLRSRVQVAVQVAHLRALPAEVVSVNGAGDTLVAGMIAALLQQQDPVHALAYGMAAAKRAVESHRNVPDLDFGSLRQDAEAVAATLQRHFFPSALAGAQHVATA